MPNVFVERCCCCVSGCKRAKMMVDTSITSLVFVLLGFILAHHRVKAGSSEELNLRRSLRSNVKITPRVIDGSNATRGRFPYYTNLYIPSLDIHNCGGSLIAPDIVLSAAHCWDATNETEYVIQVGRYELDNATGDEEFTVKKYIPHPSHELIAPAYRDFLLIVLNGTSSKPVVKLNRRSDIPTPGQAVVAIGLGATDPANLYSSQPPVLEQVTLMAIPNDQCERSTNGFFQYNGLVTSDMLCAGGTDGNAICKGDSGGPLLIRHGNSPDTDVQVGVVSWAAGCAERVFPAVYARVSEVMDWIDAHVCRYSHNPPADFHCENRTFSPAPTISPPPSYSPAPTIPSQAITITISFPSVIFDEIGYSLLDADDNTLFDVPYETYGYQDSTVEQVIYLPSGHYYSFVITSKFGTGFYDNGNCTIVLGPPGEGGPVLFSLNATFFRSERSDFFLPDTFTASPSITPSDAPSLLPTATLAPTDSVQAITLIINVGTDPENIGYLIMDSNSDQILEEAPFGTFGPDIATIEKVFFLPSQRRLKFDLKNQVGNGIYPGNCTIVLGTPDQGGPVLLFNNNFVNEVLFNFMLPTTFSAVPSMAPSLSSAPTTPLQTITLFISFGVDATSFGYSVVDSKNKTLFHVPFGLYGFGNITAVEEIHLPSDREYTFIVNVGSGFLYPGNLSVALGPPQGGGPQLFSSDGLFLFAERFHFYLPRTFSAAPSMSPSHTLVPSINAFPTTPFQAITITIYFGYNAEDIGYLVMDSNNKTLDAVPPGTFYFGEIISERVIHLPSEQEYTVLLLSRSGSGIYPGNYSVAAGRPDEGGPLLTFVDQGLFYKKSFRFFVPAAFTAVPSVAPTFTLAVAPSAPIYNLPSLAAITVTVNFKGFPSEIGYSVVDANNVTFVDAPFGTFSFEDKISQMVYYLPCGQNYTFIIKDFFGDGYFPGNYALKIGPPNGGGQLLLYKSGIDGFEEQFDLSLAQCGVPAPTLAPSNSREGHTLSPDQGISMNASIISPTALSTDQPSVSDNWSPIPPPSIAPTIPKGGRDKVVPHSFKSKKGRVKNVKDAKRKLRVKEHDRKGGREPE